MPIAFTLSSPVEAALKMKSEAIKKIEGGSKSSYLQNIDGGNICEVANSLSSHGTCPTSKVHFESKPIHEKEQLLSQLKETFKKLSDTKEDCEKELSQLFPELSTIGPVLEAIRTENLPQFLNLILSSMNCQDQDRLPSFGPKCTEIPTPGFKKPSLDEFESLIEKRLSLKSPRPIGISYCSTILSKGSFYQGMSIEMFDGYPVEVFKPDCGPHASLIIGKREIETYGGMGQKIKLKQYLIRNSWGKSGEYYSPEWENDQGNIWVSSDTLLRNLKSVSYLD